MRFYTVILALLMPIISLQAQSIAYYVKKSVESWDENELQAIINKKDTITLIESRQTCFTVKLKEDLNGDRYLDILVELSPGCNGNCCANSYQIFFFDGKKVRKSREVGYDWNGIDIMKDKKGAYQFVVETRNEGYEQTRFCTDKVETFGVKEYDFKLLKRIDEEVIVAQKEMRSSSFNNDKEQEVLSFDLDRDGKEDKIIGSYWKRWGRMVWKVEFGNGKVYDPKSDFAAKRLGVLRTKTNGVYDLVVDCNEVLKWDGKGYDF